jgi:hypothetical protein
VEVSRESLDAINAVFGFQQLANKLHIVGRLSAT